jgi:ADP-heptose:LPS heptosyltransferase
MELSFKYPSIGDTLGISALAEIYYDKTGQPIRLNCIREDLFKNNPKVILEKKDFKELDPCRTYECNIIKNYLNQLNLDNNLNLKPKIYLSEEEENKGKEIVEKFSHKKIISVCLFSSADCRDLRYDYISNLLKKLKYDMGYSLILVGNLPKKIDDYEEVFDEQFIDLDLRTICSIISMSDLYLGVDTGLFHIAAALEVPQVVFFRNSGCENNQYSNTFFHKSNTKCSDYCTYTPCLVKCTNDTRCMDDFDLNSYYKLVKLILN